MKKLFLFAVTALLLASCQTTQYVQKVDVRSDNLSETTSGYQYQDKNVTIAYNLWADGGNPGFVITNETDEIIYLDLSKSFYVSGGQAKDYFLNRTFTSSRSFAQNVSAAVSGTVLGRWLPFGAPGSKTETVAATNVKGSSSGVSYEEKPVIAIPPHTMKSVAEYSICTSPFQDCSVAMFPSGKDNASYSFNHSEAPEFGNVIVYRVGEKGEDVMVRNTFYVNSFSNMKYDKATEQEKVGCKQTKKISVFKTSSPKSFYIIYDEKTENTYSSDAKSMAF